MSKIYDGNLADLDLVIFDLDGTLIDSNGMSNELDVELVRSFGENKSSEEILIERDNIFNTNNDGDIYLKGDEGNAYTNDPTTAYLIDGLLNDHIRLANNEAPLMVADGDGSNSISLEPMDANSVLNKAEFIPRWRRLI